MYYLFLITISSRVDINLSLQSVLSVSPVCLSCLCLISVFPVCLSVLSVCAVFLSACLSVRLPVCSVLSTRPYNSLDLREY